MESFGLSGPEFFGFDQALLIFVEVAGKGLNFTTHVMPFLIDRLIFAFDPGHAGRVSRYENALSQRSKILREAEQNSRAPDAAWLDGLEAQIAETGCAIAAARRSFIDRLQTACEQADHKEFPLAHLRLRLQDVRAAHADPLMQLSPAR